MIKKALITAFGLVLFHILFFPQPKLADTAAQNQWQANTIRAQGFIYHKGDPIQNVIVGSSLARRFVETNLPGFYNLSFNGLSVCDGLNILSHEKELPRTVYVEMNVALRREDPSFAAGLYSPVLYPVRKILPSLRDESQPAGILQRMIENYKRFKQQKNGESTNNHALFEKLLKIQVASYSEMPSELLLIKRFTDLKRRVNELETRGVQIVFFEVPTNVKLYNLAKPKAIRDSFYRYFPLTKYKYIPLPDCNEYQTSDGSHLSHAEALKYTEYFKSQIASLQ